MHICILKRRRRALALEANHDMGQHKLFKKNKYLESSLYTIKVANSNNYKTIHCFCHRSKLSSQVPIRDSALKLNLEEQGLEFGRL